MLGQVAVQSAGRVVNEGEGEGGREGGREGIRSEVGKLGEDLTSTDEWRRERKKKISGGAIVAFIFLFGHTVLKRAGLGRHITH